MSTDIVSGRPPTALVHLTQCLTGSEHTHTQTAARNIPQSTTTPAHQTRSAVAAAVITTEPFSRPSTACHWLPRLDNVATRHSPLVHCSSAITNLPFAFLLRSSMKSRERGWTLVDNIAFFPPKFFFFCRDLGHAVV
jgi:hypothetical protein